ncbi:LysR family transcriptional regulator [Pigmentibacter sp. JX0631]|uniref:LysR family transcriptional regulator n=1 Tax=Pigmentibacter sp. JX0631 TaxID=2976982 RepID=UPI002468A73A|nr:LysR family transcriptional regulator [Pigmentibacter sp. JX0631]WGL59689.1 LysR family transcriptional regulator [Pigmentibacter sp. JX0631]
MKINNLDEIRAFVLLYQEKSYTKVAAKLKISKAALSNKIKTLEENIHFSLFHRSTRIVTATQEAENFYSHALKILDYVKELELSYSDIKKMEGKIHLTCSNSIAVSFLGKVIPEFMQLYKDISIELTVTDSYLDLLENNIDLAIRIGNLPSSSLVGKKMGTNKLIFACSPEYLSVNSLPTSLDGLNKHKIAYLDIHEKLQFVKSKIKLTSLKCKRDLKTNYSNVINQYGVNGGGIIVRSFWDIKDYLSQRKLIEIKFDDFLEDYGNIWLLTTNSRYENLRIKTLFQFILEKWKFYNN